MNSETLIKVGALYTPLVQQGQVWRFLTAMFLHSGIAHLLNNMLTLYVLGTMVEPVFGRAKYLLTYFAGGLAGNILEFALSVAAGASVVAIGASGAVFAVMGAALGILIRTRGRGLNISTQRMVLFVLLSVYFGFVGSNVANAAHLAGLGIGLVLSLILYR